MSLFGLPEIWRTTFDWRAAGNCAPRQVGETLVHRAGKSIVELGRGDGRVGWRIELDTGSPRRWLVPPGRRRQPRWGRPGHAPRGVVHEPPRG